MCFPVGFDCWKYVTGARLGETRGTVHQTHDWTSQLRINADASVVSHTVGVATQARAMLCTDYARLNILTSEIDIVYARLWPCFNTQNRLQTSHANKVSARMYRS